MKRKELIQLVVAVIILVAAGSLIYSQLAPQKSAASSVPTVEKITPINSSFDQNSLTTITDTSKVRDFYQQPDLSSGLGNPAPFGPLQ